jgi:phenylacetate-coenzyme A ligase PaaK-like adenylate-forming protein
VNELEGALRTVGAVKKPTLEWQVVKPRDESAPLHVRVELGVDGGDPWTVASACAAAIETEIGVKADVEVVDRGTLERRGYKQLRLVDE